MQPIHNPLTDIITELKSLSNDDINDGTYADIERPTLPESDTPLFLNSTYTYARPKNNTQEYNAKREWFPDTLMQIYRDTDGVKKLNIVEEPDYTFYVAEGDNIPEYPVDNIAKDKVKAVTVKYNKVTDAMASIVNRQDEYAQLKRNRGPDAWEAKRKFQNGLINEPRFFAADIHVEDSYKNAFMNAYGKKFMGYHKGYMDIETDIKPQGGVFPDPDIAPSAINAITYIDDVTQTVYVLALKHPDYQAQPEVIADPVAFCNHFNNKLIMIQDTINASHHKKTGKSTGAPLLMNYNPRYDMRFFETEIELLLAYCILINKLAPDFVGIWNMAFDVNTIINRIKILGYDPDQVVTSLEIPEQLRRVSFKKDVNPRVTKPALLYHWSSTGNLSQYTDAMSIYANLRKSRGVKPSYSLENIARSELYIGKLDYKDITSFSNLPYLDYVTFLEYNIFDVVLLHALENKNLDIEQLNMLSNNTRLSQATKITAIIKNKLTKYYHDNGMIIGNNVNVSNRPNGESYPGAIVSNPDNNAYVGVPMLGMPTNSHHEHVNDFDLKAMYPSIMIWSNLYKNTLYGQFKTVDDSFTKIGYDVHRFMDNLQTRDFVRLAMDVFGCKGPEYYLDGIEIAAGIYMENKRVQNAA